MASKRSRAAAEPAGASDNNSVVRPRNWRHLMEATRQAARELARQGDIVITQKGQVVDPDNLRGPIRLRLAAPADAAATAAVSAGLTGKHKSEAAAAGEKQRADASIQNCITEAVGAAQPAVTAAGTAAQRKKQKTASAAAVAAAEEHVL